MVGKKAKDFPGCNQQAMLCLELAIVRLESSIILLVPHEFTCQVLATLFYHLHNHFIAKANKRMYPIGTVLKNFPRSFGKHW